MADVEGKRGDHEFHAFVSAFVELAVGGDAVWSQQPVVFWPLEFVGSYDVRLAGR